MGEAAMVVGMVEVEKVEVAMEVGMVEVEKVEVAMEVEMVVEVGMEVEMVVEVGMEVGMKVEEEEGHCWVMRWAQMTLAAWCSENESALKLGMQTQSTCRTNLEQAFGPFAIYL
eukprot:gene1687-2341_t